MAATLDDAVTSVAILIDDPDAFRARAEVVARQLGPSAIDALSQRFHSPSQPAPTGFGPRERGLGGWLAFWQFAIFELFFQYGEQALPVLRRVAFGPYDWTQGNAIEVLVRLAAVGIDREAIIADLRREFPTMRFEAQLYAIQPLLHHAARDAAVADVIRALEDLPEWQEALEDLRGEASP